MDGLSQSAIQEHFARQSGAKLENLITVGSMVFIAVRAGFQCAGGPMLS